MPKTGLLGSKICGPEYDVLHDIIYVFWLVSLIICHWLFFILSLHIGN